MRVRGRWLAGFAIACLMCSADLNTAIVNALRSAANVDSVNLDHVQVLQRTGVDADLDLVIAIGAVSAKMPFAFGPGRCYWGEDMLLGLFLQRRDRPDMVYRVAAEKGAKDIDCTARLERVTSTEVVVSCTPEKGRFGPMRKFVYDSRAKALVKALDYWPCEMARIFVSGERAVFVGTNFEELVSVEYDPARTPAFRMLRGVEEELWTRRVPTGTGTVGLEMRREIYIEPQPFEPIHFGSDHRFALVKDKGESLLITERTGQGVIRYGLPQSTWDEFAKARPGRVRDGYTRDAATFDEHIGSWQMEGDRLWFGKTFYDGEGDTGVGGFGYFDAAEKKYRIYSPPEIADWSISAMLVEPDTIWLALGDNGEYGTTPGGLVAFNRSTERIEKFDLPDDVRAIARMGEHVLVATQFGAAVLEQGRVRRFFVDETSDGRRYVAEATAAGAER